MFVPGYVLYSALAGGPVKEVRVLDFNPLKVHCVLKLREERWHGVKGLFEQSQLRQFSGGSTLRCQHGAQYKYMKEIKFLICQILCFIAKVSQNFVLRDGSVTKHKIS